MKVKLKWSRRKHAWAIYHGIGDSDNCLGYAYRVFFNNGQADRVVLIGDLVDAQMESYTSVGRYQLKPVLERLREQQS